MTADLHTHTTASDASLSRDELLEIAKLRGLSCIAITDHDTMANSCSLEGDPVRVIEGCEISSVDPNSGKQVHILCLMPKAQEVLTPYFKRFFDERNRVGEIMLERIQKLYPLVTRERVLKYCSSSGGFYKQSMMKVLLDFGYSRELYGELYQSLFNVRTGSIVETPDYISSDEAVKMIKKARGIAVVAHAGAYKNIELVRKYARDGVIDGVEVMHPRNSLTDRESLREIAQEYGLIATGGSDYHGANGASSAMIGDYVTDDENMEKLMAISKKK